MKIGFRGVGLRGVREAEATHPVPHNFDVSRESIDADETYVSRVEDAQAPFESDASEGVHI